jgi:hypothetical protein
MYSKSGPRIELITEKIRLKVSPAAAPVRDLRGQRHVVFIEIMESFAIDQILKKPVLMILFMKTMFSRSF